MTPILEEIINSNTLIVNGKQINLHSHTSLPQCLFLQKLLEEGGFMKSLEIGLAYGISALAILEKVTPHGGIHTVLDPLQKSDWQSAGLKLIEQAGFKKQLEFHEKRSQDFLPVLVAEGRKFDFVYIDSTKLFDQLMVDFYHIDQMLEIKGMIVFDDLKFPSIRKLIRYLAQLPHYHVHAVYPENRKPPLKQRMLSSLGALPYSSKWLKTEWIRTDFKLGINAQCVALKKVAEDSRHWDWYTGF